MAKVANLLNTRTVAYLAVVGAIAGIVYYSGKKVVGVVGDNLDVVNPASQNNFIYRGFNGLFDILDDGMDNDSYDAGHDLYQGVEKIKGWFD